MVHFYGQFYGMEKGTKLIISFLNLELLYVCLISLPHYIDKLTDRQLYVKAFATTDPNQKRFKNGLSAYGLPIANIALARFSFFNEIYKSYYYLIVHLSIYIYLSISASRMYREGRN